MRYRNAQKCVPGARRSRVTSCRRGRVEAGVEPETAAAVETTRQSCPVRLTQYCYHVTSTCRWDHLRIYRNIDTVFELLGKLSLVAGSVECQKILS